MFEAGELSSRRVIRLPNRPPLTYPLDLLVPSSPRADVWFGFNSLSCLPGLAARSLCRVGRVVYWCVDFVENRFGGGALSRVYNGLDGSCCRRVDARFEPSRQPSRHEMRDTRASLPSSRRHTSSRWERG